MRLLLVTRGFPPRVGGVETLCGQLARGLAGRGEEVTVVTYGGRTPGIVRDETGYRVVRLPSHGATFEWSWQLVPLLRRQSFDVCHVHNLHATAAAAVWAAGCHPYVLTAHYHGGGHTPVARLLHPGYRLLARRIVAAAAAVTAVSEAEAALLRRDFGTDPEIIPNGVEPVTAARVAASSHAHGNPDGARSTVPGTGDVAPGLAHGPPDGARRTVAGTGDVAPGHAHGPPDGARSTVAGTGGVAAGISGVGPPSVGPPTIVVVSRLVGYKRVDAAVRALAALPDHVLHIIGDGPERGALLRLAERLGVDGRVRLTSRRLSDEEVAAAIRDAAVHVNLSAAEAFSYTVLEALAAGTPVVAAGGAALAEWARRYPAAVLTADPAHPAQVAAAIRRLSGARVHVDLGEYALPAILDRYQAVYRRVAG